MLEAAGLPIEVAAADIDERAVEARAGAASAGQAALVLAGEKAKVASMRWPGRIVVGADQTLALGEQRFSKPRDRNAAHAQLRALAGREHALHAAVAVAQDGRILFSEVDTARLTMREMSDQFIAAYLDAVGIAATSSVGAYQVEGLGIQLFARIDGNHFTILGLPLLALLSFLRRAGLLLG
jgi:septum formation protein